MLWIFRIRSPEQRQLSTKIRKKNIDFDNCVCYNASRQKRWECPIDTQKPQSCDLWGFLFRFWRGGLYLWLTTAYRLCPATCICSRQLHLPWQRVKKMRVYPIDTPPFRSGVGVVACTVYHGYISFGSSIFLSCRLIFILMSPNWFFYKNPHKIMGKLLTYKLFSVTIFHTSIIF